ncbi:ATP synthase F0, A subunit [Neorickettsia helminthoeca str. Oregon]|uniref:ATP synthase subunit a n=1 Tax=Neorickettsia helminthoeca str. Oregon TaxID=1286528 RepID=X5GW77_9RICK|nr:F0F1 ATP synthase subunit A [Neorickettsia helminthoeca]AHX11327.1 ATP synthase F0, A subunit [Neorickettsia helminthoeca str. Oregon]
MSPLKQFEVFPIFALPDFFGWNVDFTNSSLYMVLAVVLASLFLFSGIVRTRIVPGSMQSFIEIVYNFVADIVKSNCGKAGLDYLPLIFTVFLYILFANLAGMLPLPMSFTVTSHIVVTLALAIVVFVYVTVIGFRKQGKAFFSIFLPNGTPLWIAPLMILLEVCTYFFRPISLAIRLTANMIAGHTILKVIAGFVQPISLLVSPLSFAFVVVLIVFEVFIAMLQAYIFVVLVCVYLNDSLVRH